MTLPILSRYQLLEEIARGGMGTVYRAHDKKLSRDVAVKVIGEDVGSSVHASRFLREIRIAASLTHPHIVPVHDCGEENGLLYYVMPLISGHTLAERLARMDRLSGRGPWTLRVLELIDRNRGVSSSHLAPQAGRDRRAFKVDVRKLKKLGLTRSLKVGYALSTLGRALLRRWSR